LWPPPFITFFTFYGLSIQKELGMMMHNTLTPTLPFSSIEWARIKMPDSQISLFCRTVGDEGEKVSLRGLKTQNVMPEASKNRPKEAASMRVKAATVSKKVDKPKPKPRKPKRRPQRFNSFFELWEPSKHCL
jgi:hypothetical protein